LFNCWIFDKLRLLPVVSNWVLLFLLLLFVVFEIVCIQSVTMFWETIVIISSCRHKLTSFQSLSIKHFTILRALNYEYIVLFSILSFLRLSPSSFFFFRVSFFVLLPFLSCLFICFKVLNTIGYVKTFSNSSKSMSNVLFSFEILIDFLAFKIRGIVRSRCLVRFKASFIIKWLNLTFFIIFKFTKLLGELLVWITLNFRINYF